MKLLLWIKKWFFICYNNNILRYIFYGGLTTLVNWGVFFLFRRLLKVPFSAANTISVIAAILFAYFVNSRFVFRSEAVTLPQRFAEFARFVGGRAVTMLLEIGGGWLLVDVLHMNETLVKVVIIQILVLVLNYVISKFFVFTKKSGDARQS